MKEYTAASMRRHVSMLRINYGFLCPLATLDRLAGDGKYTLLPKPCLWTPACTLSAAMASASCSCVMVPGSLGEAGADDPEDKT